MYLSKSPKVMESSIKTKNHGTDAERLSSAHRSDHVVQMPRDSILAQSVPQPLSFILQNADKKLFNQAPQTREQMNQQGSYPSIAGQIRQSKFLETTKIYSAAYADQSAKRRLRNLVQTSEPLQEDIQAGKVEATLQSD